MRYFILLGGLLLSACSATEPDLRLGEWRPLNVNATNLAVMVADPNDLQHGKSAGPDESDGQMAVAAIDRMRHSKLKDLGDTSSQSTKSSGPSGSGGS
jgi:hypothetical protein